MTSTQKEPIVICKPGDNINSAGIWFGDNPLNFSTPIFMMQIALSTFFTGTFDFLLRPLGLCSFFSQMLGAFMAGPNMVGKVHVMMDVIFGYKNYYVFETFQSFGRIYFLFYSAVKMDLTKVVTSGRKALMIGISVFLVPLVIALPISIIVDTYLTTDHKIQRMLPAVALNEIQTSFHVVVYLLADLKLLNSEIGRLAMSSSTISNACSWLALFLLTAAKPDLFKLPSSRAKSAFTYIAGSSVGMVIVIVFIMRPIMLWMARDTPDGNTKLKQVHVVGTFMMVLLCAFLSELIGLPMVFGPIILGLVIPSGPPFETMMDDNLDSLVSSFLLPIFYVTTTGKTDASTVSSGGFTLVSLIVLVAFLAKFIGTVVPSIYFEMPLHDTLSLALIMCSQGVMDVHHYRHALAYHSIDLEAYCIMTYWAVLNAGITSPLVKYMYRPSRRYTRNRRSLLHNKYDSEFRILVCAYRDSDVPYILDLLEASNPTVKSPISAYLLHLIELQTMGTTLLVAHKKKDTSSFHYKRSKHMINYFQHFEQDKQGVFGLSSFTAMSHYATMHDDICSLASEKRTTLMILPFHRQINIDGYYETTLGIRNVNRNVLKRAPCSVGILIARGSAVGNSCRLGPKPLYSIGMFFLGGADDREMVIYGMRMGKQPNTTVTLLRFCSANDTDDALTAEQMLDIELVTEFRNKYNDNESVIYKEVEATDEVAIVKKMRSLQGSFDLLMVGRQHSNDSPLVQGIEQWNEYPELGYMGDLLATSTSQNQGSILVLQREFRYSPKHTQYRHGKN